MKTLSRLTVGFAALASACNPSGVSDAATLAGDVPFVGSALASSGTFVTRAGGHLLDGSHIYRAIGANRPDLAAGPGAQKCSRDSDIDGLRRRQLGTLFQMRKAGAQVARLWAFQSLAGPNGDDFSHIDSLLDVAHEVGIALILVLENHYPECSAGAAPRSAEWYADGFTRPYDGYRRSFEEYAADITRRYAGESAILMWQIVNEAQAPGKPQVVRDFMGHMAQVIRQNDRVHLIAGGGSYACGAPNATDEFAIMADASGVDVLDVHDFSDEGDAWPVCMAEAKKVADDRGLLVMVGESGVARRGKSPQERAHIAQRKMDAAADQGVGIYLLWSWATAGDEPGPFDVLAGEPMIDVLQHEATTHYAMHDTKPWALDPSDMVFLDFEEVGHGFGPDFTPGATP